MLQGLICWFSCLSIITEQLFTEYHRTLNLPQELDFGDNNRIYYHYTATGNKLIKHIYEEGQSSRILHYIENIVYEGGTLSYILTEEGRLVPFGTGSERLFVNEYNLKDHLGNNRVTFMGTDLGGAVDIAQKTSYYPFGLVMSQTNGNTDPTYQKNKYLYNGKEHQDDEFAGSSLNWYDYGARFYDPQLGRWHVIDPASESMTTWSPYNYTFNNPIRFIDPTGMVPDEWDMNKKGKVVKRVENKNEDSFHIVDSDGNRIKGKFITFEYGSVKDERHNNIKTRTREGGIQDTEVTTFDVTGDEKATELFEFMANPENTDVEWTHAKIGTKNSNKNLVGTSHDEASTAAGGYLRDTGYTLKEVAHNHPSGNSYNSRNDRHSALKYKARNNNVILKIYTHHNHKYTEYDNNGSKR